jgi:hypothetical protein
MLTTSVSDLGLVCAGAQTVWCPGLGRPSGHLEAGAALVHLDIPRWVRSHERVPHLRDLATALRRHRQVRLWYTRPGSDPAPRVVAPLDLVNNAGTWYLVSVTRNDHVADSPAGKVTSVQILDEPAALLSRARPLVAECRPPLAGRAVQGVGNCSPVSERL